MQSQKDSILNSKIAVIMPVRNEEEFVGNTLKNLLKQDLCPYRIIVINDGSTDKTSEILRTFSTIEVINRENKSDSYLKKEIANTLNVGLELLQNDSSCDFIMKLDADHILPETYLSTIVSRMKNNPKIAACSGIIKEEFSIEPRHSGRVVRYDFWKSLGLKYPVNYAYEDYLLFKAKSLGLEIKNFIDIVTTTRRKTGSRYTNPKTFYNYGRGMKALGYAFFYTFGKSILYFLKSPRGGINMMKGYFDKDTELYEKELRDYVRKSQYRNIFRLDNTKRIMNILKK